MAYAGYTKKRKGKKSIKKKKIEMKFHLMIISMLKRLAVIDLSKSSQPEKSLALLPLTIMKKARG